jgi:Protein of unknown function (DUF550)
MDLIRHIHRQRKWSQKMFGPGSRTTGILNHIAKEIKEVENNPSDISEWIDIVILALDGAWRAGHTPEQIAQALDAKQAINEARLWPDWRWFGQDQAIEHDRSGDSGPQKIVFLP